MSDEDSVSDNETFVVRHVPWLTNEVEEIKNKPA